MTDPTLAAFLLARIAEDEADAREAIAPHRTGVWTQDGGSIYDGHPVNDVVDWVYDEAWSHIARWDPARVLAECEAKRRIVELHWNTDPSCARCANPDDEMTNEPWPCSTLRLLALPYADHPDYRDEWRP